MNFNIKVNPKLSVPIYRQISDALNLAIKKGELADRSRLPTVQELSEMLNVSRGTVKMAYDELERLGVIEKVQGRGTFVNFRSEDEVSRKDKAMEAIDGMLDRLEDLGFSAAEINIFLNLKMRERASRFDNVKIALFECNPEALSDITEQIRNINSADIYSYILESVQKNPYKLRESYDIVVTTHYHADDVEKLMPESTRVVRAALRLTPECLSGIVKLRAGQRIGIACYSERFGALLGNTCKSYCEDAVTDEPFIFSSGGNINEYLKDKYAVLVPGNFEKYCDRQTALALKMFRGQLITCTYEFDEGSVLYINERVKRIMEMRSL